MSEEKIVYYVELSLKACVIWPSAAAGSNDRDYKQVFETPSSLYVVRKSVNCRGWNKHLPRLSNAVVNHHIGGGGAAVDVRLVEKMRPQRKKKLKVSDKQMGVF